jgi:hypothetical protein
MVLLNGSTAGLTARAREGRGRRVFSAAAGTRRRRPKRPDKRDHLGRYAALEAHEDLLRKPAIDSSLVVDRLATLDDG